MKPDWSCILFDLDGTITDSAPGITATLAHMFEELGLPVPTPSKLLSYVGPPLLDAFHEFAGFTPEEATRALSIYRKRYFEHGALDSTVYPGIPMLLQAIHKSGIPLSLATSKPERPATQMLDHFGLTQYFDVITGASEDETRSAKSDVVAEALARLNRIGADTSRPVLVGDREHDIIGAAEHNVPTIFVTWGYGSPAEQLGSVAVAKNVGELTALLLPRASTARN